MDEKLINSNHIINLLILIDKLLRRYTIMNEKNIISTLLIRSNGRFQIINLPEVGIDRYIYGTLGVHC